MSNYAKVRISTEYLSQILRGEFNAGYIVETDAPKDLKVIGLSRVSLGLPQQLYVICESSTFPENKEGEDFPEIEPFTYSIKEIK